MDQGEKCLLESTILSTASLRKLCSAISDFSWIDVSGHMELFGESERSLGIAFLVYEMGRDGYQEFIFVSSSMDVEDIPSRPQIRRVVFTKNGSEEQVSLGPLLREFVYTCELGFRGTLQLLRILQTRNKGRFRLRLVLGWDGSRGDITLCKASIPPVQRDWAPPIRI